MTLQQAYAQIMAVVPPGTSIKLEFGGWWHITADGGHYPMEPNFQIIIVVREDGACKGHSFEGQTFEVALAKLIEGQKPDATVDEVNSFFESAQVPATELAAQL